MQEIRVLGFKEEKQRSEAVKLRAESEAKDKEFTEDQIQNLSLMRWKMCVRSESRL